MLRDGLSIALALWGAVLSTVLAGIKIWEVRREGIRLTTFYRFHSDPAVGNDVIIQNLSKSPVMITFWSLHWVRRHWGRSIIIDGRFPEEGGSNLTIAPFSQHVLSFDYIEWGARAVHKAKLWLVLHIVGRRRLGCSFTRPSNPITHIGQGLTVRCACWGPRSEPC
jgi:hypothetical protein